MMGKDGHQVLAIEVGGNSARWVGSRTLFLADGWGADESAEPEERLAVWDLPPLRSCLQSLIG